MDDRFAALLTRHLKYASGPVTADARLRDLGLDSMRSIELLFAVEDEYRVTLPDDRLTDATFETAGNLWAVLEELRAPLTEGTH